MKRKIFSLVLILILVGSCMMMLAGCYKKQGSVSAQVNGYTVKFDIYQDTDDFEAQVRHFTIHGRDNQLNQTFSSTFNWKNGCWVANISTVDATTGKLFDSDGNTIIADSIGGNLYVYTGSKEILPSSNHAWDVCLTGRVTSPLSGKTITVDIDTREQTKR